MKAKPVKRHVMSVRAVGLLSAFLMGLFCHALWAQDQNFAADGPYAVVEQVTGDIQQVVKDKKHLLDDDPQAFYDAIGEVLETVVAFDYIASGVMGNYAKQATAEQKQRFNSVFRENLISTYAKGMAIYGLQKIVLVPPANGVEDQRRVSVTQKVNGDDGEHLVNYTMGKSSQDDSWRVLNVTINGINLGMTFRSQFTQAMKKTSDLDQVIDGWSVKS